MRLAFLSAPVERSQFCFAYAYLRVLFRSRRTHLVLAVLHPRSLVVYETQVKFASGEGLAASKSGKGPDFLSLTKLYEHKLGIGGLHFTAYNMCAGPFGGRGGEH